MSYLATTIGAILGRACEDASYGSTNVVNMCKFVLYDFCSTCVQVLELQWLVMMITITAKEM